MENRPPTMRPQFVTLNLRLLPVDRLCRLASKFPDERFVVSSRCAANTAWSRAGYEVLYTWQDS